MAQTATATSLISLITTILSGIFEWMVDCAGTVVTFIQTNPLVLYFVVFGIVGIAVSFLRRLIRL